MKTIPLVKVIDSSKMCWKWQRNRNRDWTGIGIGSPLTESSQVPSIVHPSTDLQWNMGLLKLAEQSLIESKFTNPSHVGVFRDARSACGVMVAYTAGFGAPGSNGILHFPPLCPILCINPTSRIHSTLQKNSVEYQLNFWYKRLSFTREIQEQVTNPNLCPNIIIVLSFLYFMYILKIDKMSYDSQVFKMWFS